MRSGFRIGRLFGITIYVHWTWLLIFYLVTWNLATSFTQVHPTWAPALTWGVAIVGALLFFASVLAHELAHSVVAQMQDIPVRNITLFLFGGVSNFQQEPKSPRAEFLMAIIGPITSIVLGIVFLLIAGAAGGLPPNAATDSSAALAGLDPITTILLWLGPVNILLGLFNLIPGFPLDGGRVLRAILWGATDNFRTLARRSCLDGSAGCAWDHRCDADGDSAGPLGQGLWASNGGSEVPLTNIAAVLALALSGPGAYSLDAVFGIALPKPVLLLSGLVLVVVGIAAGLLG